MADGNDINAHQGTYTGFIVLAKWGVIAAVLVTAFVIFMIAK